MSAIGLSHCCFRACTGRLGITAGKFGVGEEMASAPGNALCTGVPIGAGLSFALGLEAVRESNPLYSAKVRVHS
jgi:hypothetical protein